MLSETGSKIFQHKFNWSNVYFNLSLETLEKILLRKVHFGKIHKYKYTNTQIHKYIEPGQQG